MVLTPLGMCNNAFWAAGEIFVSLTPQKPAQEIPQQLQPFIEQFLVRSSQTLDDLDASDILGLLPLPSDMIIETHDFI